MLKTMHGEHGMKDISSGASTSSHFRRCMVRNRADSETNKVDDDKSFICQYVHKMQVFFHVYAYHSLSKIMGDAVYSLDIRIKVSLDVFGAMRSSYDLECHAT